MGPRAPGESLKRTEGCAWPCVCTAETGRHEGSRAAGTRKGARGADCKGCGAGVRRAQAWARAVCGRSSGVA
eukprot:2760377-Rhodomonas_salina.1